MVRSKEAKARRKAKLKARQKAQATQQEQAGSDATTTEPEPARPKQKKPRNPPTPTGVVAETPQETNAGKKKKKKKKKKPVPPTPLVIPETPPEDTAVIGKRKRKRKKKKPKPKPKLKLQPVEVEDDAEEEEDGKRSMNGKTVKARAGMEGFSLVNRYSKKAQNALGTDRSNSEGESTGSAGEARDGIDSAGFETGTTQVLRRIKKKDKHSSGSESDEDFDLSTAKRGSIASLHQVIEDQSNHEDHGEKTDEKDGDDDDDEDNEDDDEADRNKRPTKKARAASKNASVPGEDDSTKQSKKRKRRHTEEVEEMSASTMYQKISSFISPIKPSSLQPLPIPASSAEEEGRISPPPAVLQTDEKSMQQPTFPTSQFDYEEDLPSEKALKAASRVRELLRKRKKQENEVREEPAVAKPKAASPAKKNEGVKQSKSNKNQASSTSATVKSTQDESPKGSQDYLFLPPSRLQAARSKPKAAAKKQKALAPAPGVRSPPWLLHAPIERTPSLGHLWLHNEILHFVDFLDDTDFEKPTREKTIKFVTDLVAKLWPHAETRVFGSVVNNLIIPGSDIDMVVLNAPSKAIHILANALRDTNECERMQVITNTKVPLIKLVLKGSSVMADISFDHMGGLETGALVRGLMQAIPQLRPLTMVIKYFLKQRGLNDPFHGGLGSHQCLLTVVSMLQQVRRRLLGSEEAGELAAPIESFEDLGSLLLEYFKLYGIDLNYATTAVRLRGGGYYETKSPSNPRNNRGGHFSMENPEDPMSDLGTTAWKMGPIRRAFSLAARCLAISVVKHRRYPGQQPKSVLDSVITVDKTLTERREMQIHDLDVDMSED